MESYQVIYPSPQQFQQSSKLLHNKYDSETDIESSENGFSYQYSDQLERNSTENKYMNEDGDGDDLLELMKGFLNEVDVKGHEMFKKFVGRVGKGVPMERLVRETLHDFRGRVGSDMLEKVARKLDKGGDQEGSDIRERGVDGEVLQGKKLERFKVKTVNTIGAGVVKEEGQ